MADAQRPDPDALIAQLRAQEEQTSRGKLRIYFGANAGVGKTWAMLSAAQRERSAGRDILIGVVETHGRAETAALLGGLEALPLREVEYRGRLLPEFDLDAALARKPAILLVDELAHSNVQGSRHTKRWQDVQELLAAGIDVWTALNVQHLESLNGTVGAITGIRVHETVPDTVLDDADEVVLVDATPDELIARLSAGKVYVPQQADRAARSFFRKGNLLALRELALRRTADRVDGEVRAYRRSVSVQPVWANREALLACVGPGVAGEKVVRSCARMATQLDVPWHAVHVETDALSNAQALKVLKLAGELGATTATLSAPEPADALVRYAREHNLVRLVLGRGTRGRWRWRRALADQLVRSADDLDVLQVALPTKPGAPAPDLARAPRTPDEAAGSAWRGYAAAATACALLALLATPMTGVLELSNIVMLFLLVVVGVG
ncbi:MAG: two-component system sensor histidine kinase KdbD, partial [Giesbergeria sp.]